MPENYYLRLKIYHSGFLDFYNFGLDSIFIFTGYQILLRYGWDEHYYRMIGTVLDPNYLGVMLGMIGMYLIYKYTNRQIDKWGKFFWR